VQRRLDAAAGWNKLLRTKVGPDEVDHIPAGKLDSLR